eukprot:gnl/TRDRNA2_/TRDRNA2_89656_c0_seq1.p1 gnl/TRDRNA2_/TRDRNA2_89656_c0~~gnl/TRDRNA2_/TRDRNA2_89656_c0_seq1.p1  ORF type:complete len:711 (+),score=103.16 gnl/TRDRNA2_/TRDRNA2_89656_c0_seq1:58-2133(+)
MAGRAYLNGAYQYNSLSREVDGNPRAIMLVEPGKAARRWLQGCALIVSTLLMVLVVLSVYWLVRVSMSAQTDGTLHGTLAHRHDCIASAPSFELVSVLHNNFGGAGPDSGPEGIIYKVEEVAMDGHRRVMQLEVHAMSPYKYAHPEQNGINGKVGQLVQTAGSDVQIKFFLRHLSDGTLPGVRAEDPQSWHDTSMDRRLEHSSGGVKGRSTVGTQGGNDGSDHAEHRGTGATRRRKEVHHGHSKHSDRSDRNESPSGGGKGGSKDESHDGKGRSGHVKTQEGGVSSTSKDDDHEGSHKSRVSDDGHSSAFLGPQQDDAGSTSKNEAHEGSHTSPVRDDGHPASNGGSTDTGSEAIKEHEKTDQNVASGDSSMGYGGNGGTALYATDDIYSPSTLRLTIYDIDAGEDDIDEETGAEYVIAHGHDHSVTLADDTQIQKMPQANGYMYLATARGGVSDNPTNPSKLTDLQKSRAVTFTYHHPKEIVITAGSKKGIGQRAMQFAFVDEPVCDVNFLDELGASLHMGSSSIVGCGVAGAMLVLCVCCLICRSRLGYVLGLRFMTDAERRNRDSRLLPLPDKPATACQKRLAALDCPAQTGWTIITTEGPGVVCRSGGGLGNYCLKKSEIIAELEAVGLNGASFEAFLHANKGFHAGKQVDVLVTAYIDNCSEDVLRAHRAYEEQIRRVERYNAWVF